MESDQRGKRSCLVGSANGCRVALARPTATLSDALVNQNDIPVFLLLLLSALSTGVVVTATNISSLTPNLRISEAAKHLGIRRDRVRAWLDGYTRRGGISAGTGNSPTGHRRRHGDLGEFVELGYLREYRRKGVSLQYLRPVIDELCNVFELPYPLATKNLYLNGHEIVWKLQVEKQSAFRSCHGGAVGTNDDAG